jgi:predicted nucleic acid-binding protein
MNYFCVDASALAKRYAAETGTDQMNYLFAQLPLARLCCLMLGVAEVVSVLVRRRNAGHVPQPQFQQSLAALHLEIGLQPAILPLPVDNQVIESAFLHIERHAINSNDAILLQVAMKLAAGHRQQGNDLVLVASDQRLLRAAQREGLTTFDPETQDIVTLQRLLAMP